MNLNEKFNIIKWKEHVTELSLWEILSFSDKTLLYFYPKDNTPGCTIENKDFSSMIHDFTKLWITVIWVSKDSIQSHEKFRNTQDLSVYLISDPDLVLHKALWAYGEKNNYGRIVTGVIRSTFLLNKDWEILQQWKNVRAKWHAEKVFREIK